MKSRNENNILELLVVAFLAALFIFIFLKLVVL